MRLSLPETLAAGAAFVPPGRSMAVFRDTEGVFAISTVCTHLGCIVRPTAEGFECPCQLVQAGILLRFTDRRRPVGRVRPT